MQDLEAIQTDLDRLRGGQLGVHAFSSQVRGHDALLKALPANYRQVLFDLLDRMESSALFTEESCSFSQSGLADNVQQWIDKARLRLAQATP
jgi:hypothetical protein